MTSLDMHAGLIFNRVAASISDCDRLPAVFGYKGEGVSREVFEKIRTITSRAISLISLELVMADTPVLSYGETGVFGKDIVVASRKWAGVVSLMEGPLIIHGFVLTLGSAIETLMEERGEASLFEAYILDCFGSFFAEKAADELEVMLRDSLCKQDRTISRRFSPGYCDWNLAEGQQTISRILSPEKIGVAFLPGGAMQPVKTVSGAMISAEDIPLLSPCPFCKDKTCRHRRS